MKNDKVLPLQKFSSDFYAQFRSPAERHLDKLWEIHNENLCSEDCPYDHEGKEK